MEIPSLTFYTNQSVLNTQVVHAGYIEEGFLEIFDLIQEFQSADKFSRWVTNQKFKSAVYKNKIMDEKYIREWAYIFEKRSFFFGKLELDETKIPEDVKPQLLCLNSIFHEIEQLLGLEKVHIYSLLTESYYTVISHIIYKELIIGKLWKIYNLQTLLELYEQKHDPLRYWRKIRRE